MKQCYVFPLLVSFLTDFPTEPQTLLFFLHLLLPLLGPAAGAYTPPRQSERGWETRKAGGSELPTPPTELPSVKKLIIAVCVSRGVGILQGQDSPSPRFAPCQETLGKVGGRRTPEERLPGAK